jgi:lysozyme
MLKMDIDDNGLTFIKNWEAYVGYWYDDKVAPRRGKNGQLAYVEYTGGPVRGTLTIGYGHTKAAAGHWPFVLGGKITKEQATQLLHEDMAPVIAFVNKVVKVPVTQGQANALYSITFNFGEGNLSKSSILRKLNAGNYAGARAAFALYNKSKGETMLGLVRRRAAEQHMWDQDGEMVNALDPTKTEETMEVPVPKADDVVAPTKPVLKSSEQMGSLAQTTAGTGGIVKEVIDASDKVDISDHLDKAIAMKDRAEAFGVEPITLLGKAGPIIDILIHSPVFWVSLGVAAVGVYLFLRRRWRSRQEL